LKATRQAAEHSTKAEEVRQAQQAKQR